MFKNIMPWGFLLALMSSPLIAEEMPGEHCHGPEKVLSAPDFDMDGSVTHADLTFLVKHVSKKEPYAAILDLNVDGVLSGEDIAEVARIIEENPEVESTLLDRQLMGLYLATRHLQKGTDYAISQGFLPFTQPVQGHGYHYGKSPTTGAIDYDFNLLEPEGLNFDADGQLAAIFYYYGVDPLIEDLSLGFPVPPPLQNALSATIQGVYGATVPPSHIVNGFPTQIGYPQVLMQGMEFFVDMGLPSMLMGMPGSQLAYHHIPGFAPVNGERKDIWHVHNGSCFLNISYSDPELDQDAVEFKQCTTKVECLTEAAVKGYFDPNNPQSPNNRVRWNPRFFMLHAWIYRLNPCGTFAGTDPTLTAPDWPTEEETTLLDSFPGKPAVDPHACTYEDIGLPQIPDPLEGGHHGGGH